jgi:hypothetical protein
MPLAAGQQVTVYSTYIQVIKIEAKSVMRLLRTFLFFLWTPAAALVSHGQFPVEANYVMCCSVKATDRKVGVMHRGGWNIFWPLLGNT